MPRQVGGGVVCVCVRACPRACVRVHRRVVVVICKALRHEQHTEARANSLPPAATDSLSSTSSDSASADALSDAGSEQANGEDEFVSWLADDF